MAYDQTPMTTPYRTPSNPELTLPNTEPNKIFRTHLTALFYALWIVSVSPTYAADDLQPAQLTEIASGEASTAMARGKEALAVRDYETAFAEYRAALGQEPDKSASSPLRELALAGFTQAGMRLAEQRIAEGRWQDAEDTVRTILQPEYNPGDKSAQKLLNQLEDPWYFNKTITPEFVYQVEEVKHLLNVADGLSDSGRYDDAKKALDSILEVDPYNVAAWQGIERINKAKRRVADIARQANAPLMSGHPAKPNEWLSLGLLGALVLIIIALILKVIFGSTSLGGLENGKTEGSALLRLSWFVLAVAALALAAISIRYQIILAPERDGSKMLKVDRWTGSVEWIAD